MKYCNCSYAAKTFYGVTFQPGDVRSVPGYINNPKFVRVSDSTPETTNKPAPPTHIQAAPEVKKPSTVPEAKKVKMPTAPDKPAVAEQKDKNTAIDTNPINKED